MAMHVAETPHGVVRRRAMAPRPRLPKDEVRDLSLHVPVNKHEHRLLKAAAAVSGLSLSAWIRVVALREAGQPTLMSPPARPPVRRRKR